MWPWLVLLHRTAYCRSPCAFWASAGHSGGKLRVKPIVVVTKWVCGHVLSHPFLSVCSRVSSLSGRVCGQVFFLDKTAYCPSPCAVRFVLLTVHGKNNVSPGDEKSLHLFSLLRLHFLQLVQCYRERKLMGTQGPQLEVSRHEYSRAVRVMTTPISKNH